jgi:molecular chaperone DnaK
LEGEDTEAIEQKTQALTQAAMKLGEAIYKAQQAEAEAAAEGDAKAGNQDDDIVDADFEEVRDDDKKAS